MVKHQKISEYYENDCLQNFFLLFMLLLAAPLVKNLDQKLFYLFKKRPKKIDSLLKPNFDLSEKTGKSSYQVKQILALFCNLIAQSLG